MIVAFEINIKGLKPAWMTQRDFNRYQRDAFEVTGTYWHREFLKLHFMAGAASKYGYQTRSSKYEAYKKSSGHGDKPLIWSGDSRDLARVRDVRATAFRVRVVLNSPGFNRKSKPWAPDMREEVTATTDYEEDVLVRLWLGNLLWSIEQAAYRKREKIAA